MRIARTHTRILWMVLMGLLCSLSPFVSATAVESTTTWSPHLEAGYIVSLNYTTCPSSTGNHTITASAIGTSFGTTAIDANVFATITKPDNSLADYNFTNDLSGVYTLSYNFDQNGEYFIQAHAYKQGSGSGDINAYVYLGDLNWTTSFLNDGFDINIGALGSIRNTVTNVDGNRVYDINANTTIYYPDGTVADANALMNQLPNGEFVHAIFGPSPAGDYTVSSLFSCGSKYVHNGTGTFTSVETTTTGGTTGTGTVTTSGSGTGGGSGGRGGGGGASTAKKAQLLSITFDPPLSKNAPSQLMISVQNLTNIITDYVVMYTITLPDGSITTGKKTIMAVAPFSPTTIVAEAGFIPIMTGDHIVSASLRSINEVILYDTKTITFPVTGEHLLTLDVVPNSIKTALGLSFPFVINLLNSGDFQEKNVEIDWSLFDIGGEEYVQSNFTTTLDIGESKSLSYSPFLPLDAKIGQHSLVVYVTAYGVTQEKTIFFNVQSPNDYYAQVISELELRIDQIDNKLDELKTSGFDVSEETIMLLDVQQELAKVKGMFLAGEYTTLNTKLLDLSAKITKLAAMLDSLEEQAPLLSREGLLLLLYAGIGILLSFFFWLLYARWKESDKKKGRTPAPMLVHAPPWLPSHIGLAKCYYSKKERAQLRRKPLISRLLGLGRE
ncbi:MAG: hypothetical protein V1776_00035 [Candidatus Diapherotrites archaeon]